MTASKIARRKWSTAEKRRIVELTLGTGISTRAVALEHELDPASLSHWKALYRAGKLDEQRMEKIKRSRPAIAAATFLPVNIAADVRASQSSPAHVTPGRSSVIQLMLTSGATLRLEADRIDAAFVCALVAELRR